MASWFRCAVLVVFVACTYPHPEAHAAGVDGEQSPAKLCMFGELLGGRRNCTETRKLDVATLDEAFRNYNTACDNLNNEIIQFRKDQTDEFLEIGKLLKLRMHKWFKDGADSFYQYHRVVYKVEPSNLSFSPRYTPEEFQVVYEKFITDHSETLATRFKQIYYQAAAQYFKASPFIFKDLHAGAGPNNIGCSPTAIPFISSADRNLYDFIQLVSEVRSNGDVSTTFIQYYRVLTPSESEVTKFLNDLKYVHLPTKDDAFYHKVYAETLDQTQAAVLDTRLNLIKFSYASVRGSGEVLDFFPSMTNIQSTTRIYNPKINKCIGVGGYLYGGDCDETYDNVDNSKDWYLIEMATGDFVFRSIDWGTCLSYRDGPNTMIQSVDCTRYSDSNLWNINGGTIMAKSHPGYYLTADPSPGPTVRLSLKSNTTSVPGSQTWSVSAAYSNSAVLTAKYYTNSTPEELIRNFPRILKAYMFKQFHNEGSATHDTTNFFNGVKNLPYFAKLPARIQIICNALSGGQPIPEACKDIKEDYKEMRSSLLYDDGSRVGSYFPISKQSYKAKYRFSQVFPSFADTSIKPFVDDLNGQYLRAGLNMISIIIGDNRYDNRYDKRSILRPEDDECYPPNKKPCPTSDSNGWVVRNLDDARSIVRNLSPDGSARSPFSFPLFPPKRYPDVPKILGEVVGLSRMDDSGATEWIPKGTELIPMTTLFNNDAVCSAYEHIASHVKSLTSVFTRLRRKNVRKVSFDLVVSA